MSKYKKEVIVIAVLFAVMIIIAASAGLTAGKIGTNAYALDPIEIITQPKGITGVYGEGKYKLEIKLSVPNAVATYVWYKSEREDSVGVKVSEGEGINPSAEVRYATDSGYYYCAVTSVSYDGQAYGVNLVSEKAKVNISPKPVNVKAKTTELTYNGEWQSPELVIDDAEIVKGDTVNAYLETEKTTKNAGVYSGKIRLDNPQYKVNGDETLSFSINKAKLVIKIKEVGVRAGRDYEFEIEYDGFKGTDDESVLDFTPEVPSRYYGLTVAGVYEVTCTGKEETENYYIVYEPAKLYVNEGTLEGGSISGIEGTAGGSFRPGTTMTVKETELNIKGFTFLKSIKSIYTTEFPTGGADGETFTLNIEDDTISPFMLAVCLADKDGNTERTGGFVFNDGVLSVTVPTDFDGAIVIYNDYTVLLIIGIVLFLVLLITLLVIFKSKQKYNTQLFYYRAAEKEADRYRNNRR